LTSRQPASLKLGFGKKGTYWTEVQCWRQKIDIENQKNPDFLRKITIMKNGFIPIKK
jgi:hypothetical protein